MKKPKTSAFFSASLALVALLSGASVSQGEEPKPLEFSISGNTITVPPVRIRGIEFPGGQIKAIGEGQYKLISNLKTRALHLLPRSLGDGEIVMATVSVSKDGALRVDAHSPALPITRIPISIGKLASGAPLRIATLGTSLTENGTYGSGWQKLLFDPQNPEQRFYVGRRGAGNIKTANFAVGGTNARYTAALLGTAWRNGVKFPSTAFDCDLAIVGILANGGEGQKAAMEGVVRLLRNRGIEVLLLTDNPHRGKMEGDPIWELGHFTRQVADRYGCALADTGAYQRAAAMRGENVYADSIHQNTAGHVQWAMAVAGVLAPKVPLDEEPANSNANGPALQNDGRVPSGIVIDFSPDHVGGMVNSSAPGNRLAACYGVRDAGCIVFPAGAEIVIARQRLIAADLIFDASSGFSAEVFDATNGNRERTIVHDVKISPAPSWMIRPLSREIVSATDASISRSWRIKIRNGELRLYGVAYQIKEPRR